MVLAVTTDLTSLTDAETVPSGWVAIGAQSFALEPDFFVQGSNSVSRAVSGAGTEKGMWFNNGSGLDFSSAGAHYKKLIYIWMRVNTSALIDTMANGGLKIWVGTSTTNYATFTVGGSDFGIPDNEGWICYVIDPSLTPTASGGSGLNLASIQYIGGTIKTTTTAKGQNFGIDRISYGRGIIKGTGTATTGKGFTDLSDWDWSTNRTNRYGPLTVKGGIIYCKGLIQIGDNTGTLATSFTSNDEVLVWEQPMYYNGTSRVKAVPDADAVGRNYFGIDIVGNATGATNVTIGTIVGTSAGRSGSSFQAALNSSLSTPARPVCRFTASDTNVTSLKIYSSTFRNFERTSPSNAFDMTNRISTDECFGNTFDGCGRIYFAAIKVRNCNFLNSFTDATDGAIKWDNIIDIQTSSLVNNTRAIIFEATTGTPFSFVGLQFSPTTNAVRNESNGAITINISGGGNTPTADNAGTSTTTINSSVSITLTGLKNPTEVRVFNTGTTTEIAGQEDVTTGSFTFGVSSGVGVDISILALGYQNMRILNYSTTSDVSIPISQNLDRQYLNP